MHAEVHSRWWCVDGWSGGTAARGWISESTRLVHTENSLYVLIRRRPPARRIGWTDGRTCAFVHIRGWGRTRVLFFCMAFHVDTKWAPLLGFGQFSNPMFLLLRVHSPFSWLDLLHRIGKCLLGFIIGLREVEIYKNVASMRNFGYV